MTWQEVAGLVSFGLIMLFFSVLMGVSVGMFIGLIKRNNQEVKVKHARKDRLKEEDNNASLG